MSSLKLFFKRKSYSIKTIQTITLPTTTPSLPHYSSVNPNTDTYLLNSTLDHDEIDSPVKIHSKTSSSSHDKTNDNI